jgi:hypothetical protein
MSELCQERHGGLFRKPARAEGVIPRTTGIEAAILGDESAGRAAKPEAGDERDKDCSNGQSHILHPLLRAVTLVLQFSKQSPLTLSHCWHARIDCWHARIELALSLQMMLKQCLGGRRSGAGIAAITMDQD